VYVVSTKSGLVKGNFPGSVLFSSVDVQAAKPTTMLNSNTILFIDFMKLLKMIMSLEITPNQKAIQFFEWLKLKTAEKVN
jgi:hypothetical protein